MRIAVGGNTDKFLFRNDLYNPTFVLAIGRELDVNVLFNGFCEFYFHGYLFIVSYRS